MEFPHNKKNKKKGKSSRKGEYSSNVPMSSSVPPPAVKIEDKLLLRAALKSAADSGAFMDTKFYAFSRRDPSRKVYEPKAVYANGWLLRARVPSYFEPRKRLGSQDRLFYQLIKLYLLVLAGGYKESTVGSLHGNFPSNQPASNSEYGYDSDSDLEDDEEEEGGIITLMASRLEECMTGETLQPEKDAGDVSLFYFHASIYYVTHSELRKQFSTQDKSRKKPRSTPLVMFMGVDESLSCVTSPIQRESCYIPDSDHVLDLPLAGKP